LTFRLLLGLAALGIGFSSFLMVKAYQGGGSTCSLQPVPGVEVTASSLAAAVDRTREAAAAAREGRVSDAELAFAGYCTVCTQLGVQHQPKQGEAMFGRVHDLAHNVDGALRPLEPSLAQELCRHVVALEVEFWTERRPAEVARLLEAVAADLEAARRLLTREERP